MNKRVHVIVGSDGMEERRGEKRREGQTEREEGAKE
jgi:hypothetical protein